MAKKKKGIYILIIDSSYYLLETATKKCQLIALRAVSTNILRHVLPESNGAA